ncbi:MAG: SOS response-associated peptidase [Chloroflexota bacterium]|nr:SOS response-associated peptidase [Dehalococcoidia bacterium]MDW8253671.1 SOS response-associated peptidase [Chloroflexota bacterium]
MCGRYTLTAVSQLRGRFSLDDMPAHLPQRFNIAPSEPAPIISRAGRNQLEILQWGIQPRWAKERAGGRLLINARAESVADSRLFAPALRARRVIVPATGWYEWKETPAGKQPYYFRRKDGELVGFAGLALEEPEERGFVIITTEAPPHLRQVHDRMPAVLHREDEDPWLDRHNREPADVLPLLRPYDEELLVWYPVSRMVNRSGYDDPRMIEPLPASS